MTNKLSGQGFVVSSPSWGSRRHNWRFAVLIAALLLGIAGDVRALQRPEAPELVLHNGKIVTVDDSFQVVEAVAVSGGRVTAVGRNQDIMPLISPTTRVIDLQGRTVLPGLIDTHIHPQQYASYHFMPDVAPEVSHPQLIEGETVEELLMGIRTRIQRDLGAQEDMPWLVYVLRRGRAELTSVEFGEQVTRTRLDGLSPDRPLIVFPQGYPAVVNSAGLEALRKIVPLQALEAELDASGEPTGRLGYRARAMINHLVPGARSAQVGVRSGNWERRTALPWDTRIEGLARAFKLELEEWVAAGITTWQSKMTHESYAAFALLDRRGEMPNRLAAALDPIMAQDETASQLIASLTQNSTISPYMWMVGVNGSAGGTTISGACTTIPLRPRFQKMHYGNSCSLQPGSRRWGVWYNLVSRGFRIGEFHAHGDLTIDYLLLLIEQASVEAGMTIEQIREKRHAIDHCPLGPRPDQMVRAVRLGVVWTCGPKYIAEAPYMPYDPEQVAKLLVPVRSMIAAGLRPGFHTDGHTGIKFYFKYLEILQTRKDLSGRVWNADEAIDRKDALRMATRWNAEYLLAEDKLGSIEPGKWADMVVIDRDYLTIPVEAIGQIQVMMTIVGGKIAYQRPEIAAALTFQ
ncbi:MAG: amidohydrolase family protein [Acidobacteria bacterium]|nr:amidohydrolase family protein [Acidobacteriota bacterium]